MFSVLHAVPVVGKWETIQHFIELVSTSGDWLLQPMELQERSKETGRHLSWRLSHPFRSSFAECNSLVFWATHVSPEQVPTGISEACQKLQARVPDGWDDAELLLIGTGPCSNSSRMSSKSLKYRNISSPLQGHIETHTAEHLGNTTF